MAPVKADELRRTIRSETYEINGQRYDRLEDVPAKYRKFFIDANGNGIPDFFEDFADGEKLVHRVDTSRIVQTHNLDDSVFELLGLEPELLRCAQCGYDLHGASYGRNCPECGYSVGQSVEYFAEYFRPKELSCRAKFVIRLIGLIAQALIFLLLVAALLLIWELFWCI